MARATEERSAFLKQEIETELGTGDQAHPWLSKRRSWILAATVTALFCSLLGNVWLALRPRYGAFPTDMKDAQRAIEYETRVYTGALIFDEQNKRMVRVKDPGTTEYFGPPSRAVDDAWHDLLRGQFPMMTDAEARPYLPNLTKLETGHYHFDPDFFHSLHCLNGIRSILAGPLYSTRVNHMIGANPEDMRAHMDHCMDRIRQALMCHGDLSPSPLYAFEGTGPIGKAGQHTCRKWEPIRAWMDERGRKGPVYGEG